MKAITQDKQLTHQQRLDLAEKMKEEERKLLEEWGTSWEKLVQEYEQSMDTILTNQSTIGEQ